MASRHTLVLVLSIILCMAWADDAVQQLYRDTGQVAADAQRVAASISESVGVLDGPFFLSPLQRDSLLADVDRVMSHTVRMLLAPFPCPCDTFNTFLFHGAGCKV
jgi:hypothetical protein